MFRSWCKGLETMGCQDFIIGLEHLWHNRANCSAGPIEENFPLHCKHWPTRRDRESFVVYKQVGQNNKL